MSFLLVVAHVIGMCRGVCKKCTAPPIQGRCLLYLPFFILYSSLRVFPLVNIKHNSSIFHAGPKTLSITQPYRGSVISMLCHPTMGVHQHRLHGTISANWQLWLHLGCTMQINFSSTPNTTMNNDNSLTAGTTVHDTHSPPPQTARNNCQQLWPKIHGQRHIDYLALN